MPHFIAEQLNACTVHLINDGVSVTASTVTIEFAGTGPVITFLCSVDRGESSLCKYSSKYSALRVATNCARGLMCAY